MMLDMLDMLNTDAGQPQLWLRRARVCMYMCVCVRACVCVCVCVCVCEAFYNLTSLILPCECVPPGLECFLGLATARLPLAG